MSTETIEKIPYKKKDFMSSREVKWCPGCGDYAILAAVQKAMADLGRAKDNQVVVSGIGCSSRFPVYMDTYGFHTLHGRAPTVATGIKVANPDLDVWMVTGDGDGMSIGGNHLMHLIRRNVDMVVLLFNNEIYGLTKGQTSPTSKIDKVTKSTPMGSVDRPVNPLLYALSSSATFVARTYDTNPKHMEEVFKKAQEHKGTAFVEIYQNCVIFNDGAFADVTDRKIRDENILPLEDGQPLIYGKESEKCLILDGLDFAVANVADVNEDDIVKHNATTSSLTLHQMLATLRGNGQPTPMGILRQVEEATYEKAVNAQVDAMIEQRGPGNIDGLLRGHAHWDIEEGSPDIEVDHKFYKPFNPQD